MSLDFNQFRLQKDELMKFTVSNQDAPAGVYQARFTGVDEGSHPEFGDNLLFKFSVVGGEHKGKQIARCTGVNPTPRSALMRMLTGLAGRQIAPDEVIDTSEFEGRVYSAVVEQNGERSRIASIVPAEG